MNTEITLTPAMAGVPDPKAKKAFSRVITLGTVLAAFVSAHGAQAQSGDVAKTLMELERAWVAALVKADTAKLDAILVNSYVDTDEGGHRSGKQENLAVLKSGDLKLRSIELSNMKVYIYGDAAVVTGAAAQDGSFKGASIKGDIVFTDTFVLNKGVWKAAASQRTTAPK